MKKLNILSIPENPRWRTSIRCFPVATLLLGGAMYGCPHCGNLNFPMQIQNRNTAFIVVSINGELQFLLLLVMTLWNVLHAGIKWSYLNSITTTNAYPSKNSMREPCPNLPESIPLHDFLWYNLPIERKDRIEHQYRGITQKISG